MKEVIITAGGTREKIDDVRYVGNFSSGRLGHAIAGAHARYTDHKITLIAPNSTIERFGLPDGVHHEPFVTSQDLRDKLFGIATADYVYHSAAVSDFVPEVIDGKINSRDINELSVTMKRSPKIISELRDHFGDKARLVGFKLLSKVTRDEELYMEGYKQILENRLDVCIANDLQEIKDGKRMVHIVRAPGLITGWGPAYGTTDEVALKIAADVSHEVRHAFHRDIWMNGVIDD